jgi:tetratricopeptide (TPR) repeat protein
MRLVAGCLAAWIVSALAATAGARELWEYDWVEVRTPHFVIASAEGEKKAVALAIDLEHFRAAAERLTNIGRFEERIPTKVYALPRTARELGIDGTIVGLLMPGMRANYALTTPQGSQSDEVLKHEYVHFLVRNRDGLAYPAWIDEGYAELLATVRVSGGGTRLEYGNVMRWRAESLMLAPWISWDTVVGTRDPRSLGRHRGAMFYAQSWLLMHYLVIDRAGRSFGADTSAYLQALAQGTSDREAFARAYGIEVEDLGKKLRSYLGRMKFFRTRLTTPLPEATAALRPLPRDEIAAELGVIALLRGEVAAAAEYFEAALELDPENGLALVGAGDVHKARQEWHQAVTKYERAIESEPENASHLLDYGEYFLTRAELEQDVGARRGLLVEARKYLARSYRLDPDNPETLDQNGLSYLLEGSDAARAVQSLEAAHELLPSHPQIRADLAAAYLENGEPERARMHLRRLLAWGHSGHAERVTELLARLPEEPTAVAEGANDADTPAAE